MHTNSSKRWANIIVGIVYAGFLVFMIPETFSEPSAYAILMEVSKVVVPAVIVWYEWESMEKT